jgi:flavodoxin
MKSLVVYYSRSGNTRFVAEKIAQEMNGDIEEIIDKKRRKGPLGFVIGGFDATRGKVTEIEEIKKSPRDYDLLIVGTPMWNKRITPAVRTYLENNNVSEKKVAIFCTSQGSKSDRVFKTLKEIMQGCIFVGELSVPRPHKDREATEKKIGDWVKSLKV